MLHGIVVWGAAAIAASVLAGFLAGVKNRDLSFWMAWCFLVPPLVLWLTLAPQTPGTASASAHARSARPRFFHALSET